jgi:DNA-binding response OmpR family regulator
MIIEGNPSLARLYREELEEAGFGVWVSRDLRGALETLRRSPVDVLVTDLDTVPGRPESWVAALRQIHDGEVLLLGRGTRGLGRIKELRVMEKSSDLSSLVTTLRGMASSLLWSRAAGSC